MTYTAIIFDLDGTIIDTEQLWHGATQSLIRTHSTDYSIEKEQELQRALHGMALKPACELIKHMFDIPLSLAEMHAFKNHYIRENLKHGVRFMPGFEDFFSNVRTRNIPTAIATNATGSFVTDIDNALNLSSFFGKHIYHMEHVHHRSKPDPAIYLYAAQSISQDPSTCIAIEDSPTGVTAAKSAGMYCIALAPSGSTEHLTHADIIVQSYQDINLALLQAFAHPQPSTQTHTQA